MANFMHTNTPRKPVPVAITVVLIVMVLPLLLTRLAPLLLSSWNLVVYNFVRLWMLIRRRPFVYILVNFIIITILASSSFSLHLNHLLLKFHKKMTKPKTSHDFHEPVMVVPSTADWDVIACATSEMMWNTWGTAQDDTWSCRHIGGDQDYYKENPEEELMVRDHLIISPDDELKEGRKQEPMPEKEEDDTLDATWEAIMEAKKGGGPKLKKSDTWSSGEGGGGGGGGLKKSTGGKELRKGRLGGGYQVELKKWQTFTEAVEEKQKSGGGWRRMEVVLTDHDQLKKRADEFIARFTDDIKLQRLESDQRFLEMINRGL